MQSPCCAPKGRTNCLQPLESQATSFLYFSIYLFIYLLFWGGMGESTAVCLWVQFVLPNIIRARWSIRQKAECLQDTFRSLSICMTKMRWEDIPLFYKAQLPLQHISKNQEGRSQKLPLSACLWEIHWPQPFESCVWAHEGGLLDGRAAM